MVAVWILAFLVNGPMILASDSWKNSTNTKDCEPGFVTEWYILTITMLLEFLLPVISVAYFNVQIYWSLWKRRALSRCPSHAGFSTTSSSASGHLHRAGVACRTSNPGLKESAASRHSESPRRKSSILVSLRTHMNSSITAFKVGSFWRSESAALRQREYAELLRGRKLARSLAILLSAFAICWAPYCLFTIVLSTYPRTERPKSVWYSIAFWLQWFNRLLIPFCTLCVTGVSRRLSGRYFVWQSNQRCHRTSQYLLEENCFTSANFSFCPLNGSELPCCSIHSSKQCTKCNVWKL